MIKEGLKLMFSGVCDRCMEAENDLDLEFVGLCKTRIRDKTRVKEFTKLNAEFIKLLDMLKEAT